jgi:16S rRNA processing protein RimM
LNREPSKKLQLSLIPFGRVSKTHGLSGEVRILPFSRRLENLARLERIFIQIKQEENPVEFKVIRRRLEQYSALVKLEGIESVDAAEELRGCIVMVDPSQLSETEKNEYYWFQLIGLRVYTTDGRYLGLVEDLIDRASQDILVVKEDKKEYLIPMIETIVREINLEASCIVIFPIKGLLD